MDMKKIVFIIVIVVLGVSCQSLKVTNSNQTWNFIELSNLITEEFPEAYEDFTQISFERIEDKIYPVEATFLIPTKYFENTLNIEILKHRTNNLLHKMGDPGSCHEVFIGETSNYSWSKWKDKAVTKVIIKFNIGC